MSCLSCRNCSRSKLVTFSFRHFPAARIRAANAYSEVVTIRFRGVVTTIKMETPGIALGDQLDWEFTYEVDASGTGATTDFSSGLGYRSLDIVTSASATIGNTALEGPITNPFLGRSSFLQVSDGTQVGHSDLFKAT